MFSFFYGGLIQIDPVEVRSGAQFAVPHLPLPAAFESFVVAGLTVVAATINHTNVG